MIAANSEAIEDESNLFVGSGTELQLFGGVVPAAGSPAGSAIAAAAVPEPSTLVLLAAAGTFLLLRRPGTRQYLSHCVPVSARRR